MNTLCVECGESVSETEEECSNCGTKTDISKAETMISDSDVTLDSDTDFEQAETLQSKTKIESSKTLHTENNLIGKTIGGAVVKKKIGKGGMGSVYLAHHLTLDIPVAIKFLKPEYAQTSPDAVERFLKEARAVAKLRHPNIVSVYNAGFEEGFYFMSMELIDGRDLSEVLESPFQLSLKDALRLTCQVCDALHYAHKNNIVHRDIKPANIFIGEDGSAKVGDLGLAKDLEDDQNITQPLQAMGTPYYISPEQATDAKEVDHRTDIYSLGCTFYRLFCGKVPFKGNSSIETVSKHLSEPVPDPLKENSEIPPKVAKVIQKMMAKKPEERFKDLKEVSDILRNELDSISDSKIGFSPQNDVPKQTESKNISTKGLYVIIALLFSVIIVITLALTLKSNDGKQEENLTGITHLDVYNLAKKNLERGDYLTARKLFKDFFELNEHAIDAHLDYGVVLKQSEGIEGAREEYRVWKQKSKSPSVHLGHVLHLRGDARTQAKRDFEKNFPDYAPYYYYASLDWIKDAQNQTFAEKREELRLLNHFHELDSKGKFLKYFINRQNVDDFRIDAEKRRKRLLAYGDKLTHPVELEVGFAAPPQNPSVIIGEGSRDRSVVIVRLKMHDYPKVKEIFYKLPEMKEFKSIGLNIDTNRSPKISFAIKRPDGSLNIEVKYIDKKGMDNGPFSLVFNPLSAEVTASKNLLGSLRDNLSYFRDFNDKIMFYFTTILSAAKGMKEIKYSIDNKSLDQLFPFDPLNPYEKPYIFLPADVKSIFVQITFNDDSKSELYEFIKPGNLRKE